jgi:hypothetical protein
VQLHTIFSRSQKTGSSTRGPTNGSLC